MTGREKKAKKVELTQRATEYARDKAEESVIKKRLESNNTSIKALMEMLGENEVETEDGSTVCYGVTKRESMNEDKLLEVLHKYAPDTKCIKTKEYVDMDVLESEIYNNKLSAEAMTAFDGCRVVKEIPTLTVKKPKKGK